MTVKAILYAAVGAPVVAARKVVETMNELRSSLNKEADTLGKTANERMTLWASEGEKVVNRISDAKMVDELTSKVDFDQVSTQVSKLRDQLEDMLSTWRASFRPEKMPVVKAEASGAGVKVEAKKPAAQKKAGQKTASPKLAGKKAPTKKAAAKKAAAKKVPTKKAAAKSSGTAKVTTKTRAAKNAAANKAPANKAAANKAGSTRKSVAIAS